MPGRIFKLCPAANGLVRATSFLILLLALLYYKSSLHAPAKEKREP